MHTQLAVLGGGPGGYAAAFLAADLGMEVTLVEAEPKLGGVCLLRGCIPSKALLNVAKVIHEAEKMADWGVTFGQPKLDLDLMRARKQKVIDSLATGLATLSKQRKVKVIQARGVFRDSDTLLLEPTGGQENFDRELTFDHCVLATGSYPTKIPTFDLPTKRVLDSTSALELPEIPESLLVVGGGYIGLEMGSVYAALGTKVTVVEMLPALLAAADRDLVEPLQKKLQAEFAAIYLNTKAAKVEDQGDSLEVTFEGQADPAVQRFSYVMVSVGRRPNSRNLGLENTQVEVDAKTGFVKADQQQRTADPKISAIGDVAGEPMLAHKAAHQGKVAIEALHGEPVVFNPRAIPAVVYTDPELAWAGLTEREAKEQAISHEVAKFPWQSSGRAQAVGKTTGLTKLIIEPQTERILGAGLVGTGAGDMISETVLMMEMGATVQDLVESIHPHPTLSETIAGSGEAFRGVATDLPSRKRRKPQAQPAAAGH